MTETKDRSVKRDHICGTADNRQYMAGRVTGASHKRQSKPCQDAYAVIHSIVNEQSITIMAVADGHGSDKYDLSEYGAKIAVSTAVDILKDMCRDFADYPHEMSRVFKNDFPRLVSRRWNEGVTSDARMKDIVRDHSQTDQQALVSRYGTTLLAAVVTDRSLYVGQLGDGDILLIHHSGEIEVPFPPSDELIGNVTHSLSHPEGFRFWTTTNRVLPQAGFSLMLSTDGLSNCFENDESFHQFAISMHAHIKKEGTSRFGKSLSALLTSCSEKGSADDVTIAFLYHEQDDDFPQKGSSAHAADRPES